MIPIDRKLIESFLLGNKTESKDTLILDLKPGYKLT